MATCDLAQSMRLCLNELQDAAVHVFVLPECFLKMVERNPHRRPSELHTAVRGCVHRTDQVKAPYETFATHDPDLRGEADCGDRKNRRETGGEEERM